MQPEEVLEHIGSAPERYDTVRAALRYRGDGSTMRIPRDRYRASEAYRLETGGSPDPSEEVWYPEPYGPFGWSCRVWYAAKVSPEGGARSRLEVELPMEVYPDGGVYISAWDGRVSGPNTAVRARIGGGPREDDPPWLSLAQDSFWSTYLFDPDGIAGLTSFLFYMDLSVEGRTRKAGREAIRLVGVPVEEWDYWSEPLWWGADGYEFLVDSERGVLLRSASRLGGKDIDALEVKEIHFDEELPEDVFSSREPLPWR